MNRSANGLRFFLSKLWSPFKRKWYELGFMIALNEDGVSPKSLPHPPGPANFARFMGITYRHLFRMMVDPLSYACKVGHKYGDLSSFLFLTKRIYIVNHPDLLHQLLVRHRDDYKRATWQTRVLRQVLGNGLLMSDGDLWLRQRPEHHRFHQSCAL